VRKEKGEKVIWQSKNLPKIMTTKKDCEQESRKRRKIRDN
jgi:hypothetical protein